MGIITCRASFVSRGDSSFRGAPGNTRTAGESVCVRCPSDTSSDQDPPQQRGPLACYPALARGVLVVRWCDSGAPGLLAPRSRKSVSARLFDSAPASAPCGSSLLSCRHARCSSVTRAAPSGKRYPPHLQPIWRRGIPVKPRRGRGRHRIRVPWNPLSGSAT